MRRQIVQLPDEYTSIPTNRNQVLIIRSKLQISNHLRMTIQISHTLTRVQIPHINALIRAASRQQAATPIRVHLKQVPVLIQRSLELPHLFTVFNRVRSNHSILGYRIYTVSTRVQIQIIESLLLSHVAGPNELQLLRITRVKTRRGRLGALRSRSEHDRLVRAAADHIQLLLLLIKAKPNRSNSRRVVVERLQKIVRGFARVKNVYKPISARRGQ